MAQFLDNTIYTNYALNKICENLAEQISNFNFIKVKVGSGDNTLSQDRKDLSVLLYSLVIQDLVYNQEKGIITIICEIPPELADVPITEIGLFDTILGFDHLFSYSKVDIVKPSDIGYELTIVLNLGPKTIDFPGITRFKIAEEEYATVSSLSNFSDTYLYVTTNLERVVRSNADVIGKNMAEIAYIREKRQANTLRNVMFANLYYSLLTKLEGQITDLFFIHEPDYLSYDIVNFTNKDSFLSTYYSLWQSNKDFLSLNKGATSIIFVSKFDDLGKESTVFNKKNETDFYFSVDIKQNSEPYLLYNNNNVSTYQSTNFSELVVTIYGLDDVIELRYVFDMVNSGNYVNQSNTYILTFNGDLNNPEFHFYVNGVEPLPYTYPTTLEDPVEKQAGVTTSDTEEERAEKIRAKEDELKGRLYGKLITVGTSDSIKNKPDFSNIPLKNYLVDYIKKEKYGYDNALGTTEIMTVKKQLSEGEVALITNVFSKLEENQLKFL